MSGMLNWIHFRYFGECRNHSAVLMLFCYSLVVVWLDRIVSPHFSLHKVRRKNTLCRNAGTWVKWFDVCSPQKVRQSRSFWKTKVCFLEWITYLEIKMSMFSSHLGIFPRDSICWGSFSPFFTLSSSCSAYHSLSVDVLIADIGQSCSFTLTLLNMPLRGQERVR